MIDDGPIYDTRSMPGMACAVAVAGLLHQYRTEEPTDYIYFEERDAATGQHQR